MNPQEKRAYEIFKRWAGSRHLKIIDCRREGKGYDFETVDASGKMTTYEVKGSKRTNAIPDLSAYEVDNNEHTQLKADFLFVVGNILQKGKEIKYLIPRDEIKPENFKLKRSYRIRRFQNQKVMAKFRIP